VKTFESNPTWWPPILNPKITKLCDKLKHVISSHRHKYKPFPNLTAKETQALKNLKRNDNITIKKADKSAGIVILNTIDYETKIYTMLNDNNTYTLTDIDDTTTVKTKADELLFTLYNQHYINKKQFTNLTDFIPRTPQFYGIPKIHKINNPLRPIVSQIDGPTSSISKYLDKLLTIAEAQIPFLLQDTTAFLQLIDKHRNIEPNTILVTLDVVSLYTNIPHVEGAKLVTEFYSETLDKWPISANTLRPISPERLEELILFVLQHTTFEFNGNYYTQNYGTTMGANFSVKFANIYMHKFLTNFVKYKELHFLARLVDDIFFFWHSSTENLIKFIELLNTQHKTIKFELNYSHNEINFLDTIIYIDKNTNTLHSKLYTKPTAKNQYLHFTSQHPIHVKKAIPYSQGLRLRRIIDDDNIFQTELQSLKHKFLVRGYPQKLLNSKFNTLYKIKREDTLKYKTNTEKRETFNKFTKGGLFLPFILTYSSSYERTPTLKYEILKEWHNFLENNETLKLTFQSSTPQLIYKRSNTLQNMLTHTKHIPVKPIDTQTDDINIRILNELERESLPYVKKCNHPLCQCCTSIIESNCFQSTRTGHTFPIETNMNCNSFNVIYLITCLKCKLQYVGETYRKLKDRLNDHKSNIRTNKETAIGIHFRSALHNIKHLQIQPILQINTESHTDRLQQEKYWMDILKTFYPNGLNKYPLEKY